MLQAPDKFTAAATRNPLCNIALMVGTTDIPDWCYAETYGSEGKNSFTEIPSAEDLTAFYRKSPVFHLSKVWLLWAAISSLIWMLLNSSIIQEEKAFQIFKFRCQSNLLGSQMNLHFLILLSLIGSWFDI